MEQFIELSKHPHYNKEELKKEYQRLGRNPRYSGKTIKDDKGSVIRKPGFYID